MSYRPICDTWILTRPKVKFYGAYPAGFLGRARDLLGVRRTDAVLHVCAGKVREYPYRGLGKNDKTLDLDPLTAPDYCQDAREPLPLRDVYSDIEGFSPAVFAPVPWDAVLIDRPYTADDAAHYAPGSEALPSINALLRNALLVIDVGSKVGILDYVWPGPPKNAKETAIVGVFMGRNNRARCFSVFERLS